MKTYSAFDNSQFVRGQQNYGSGRICNDDYKRDPKGQFAETGSSGSKKSDDKPGRSRELTVEDFQKQKKKDPLQGPRERLESVRAARDASERMQSLIKAYKTPEQEKADADYFADVKEVKGDYRQKEKLAEWKKDEKQFKEDAATLSAEMEEDFSKMPLLMQYHGIRDLREKRLKRARGDKE